MGNTITAAELTRELAARHRVLMLGGLAVISHGHSRPTYDADIWLDSTLSHDDWTSTVIEALSGHPDLKLVTIGTWLEIPPADLANLIQRDGVVRVMGASQPLDIFRDPNELDISDFNEVWNRATTLDNGMRVPDVIDLLVTKQATGRDKDMQDIVSKPRPSANSSPNSPPPARKKPPSCSAASSPRMSRKPACITRRNPSANSASAISRNSPKKAIPSRGTSWRSDTWRRFATAKPNIATLVIRRMIRAFPP